MLDADRQPDQPLGHARRSPWPTGGAAPGSTPRRRGWWRTPTADTLRPRHRRWRRRRTRRRAAIRTRTWCPAPADVRDRPAARDSAPPRTPRMLGQPSRPAPARWPGPAPAGAAGCAVRAARGRPPSARGWRRRSCRTWLRRSKSASSAVTTRPEQDVGVPGDHLGRRVHDDVGPGAQRLLQQGGGKGVVHHEGDAGRQLGTQSGGDRRSPSSGWSAIPSRPGRRRRPRPAPPRCR